jgi:hypothetical protein
MADSQVINSFNIIETNIGQTTPDRPIRTSIPNAPERIRYPSWYESIIINTENQNSDELNDVTNEIPNTPEIRRRFENSFEEPSDQEQQTQTNQENNEESEYDEYEDQQDREDCANLCPGCDGYFQCYCREDNYNDHDDYDDYEEYVHYCGDRTCIGDCGELACGCIDVCRGRCGRDDYY